MAAPPPNARSGAVPHTGYYPFSPPGDRVSLFEGDAALGDLPGKARIYFEMNGKADLKWEFDHAAFPMLGSCTLRFIDPLLGAAEAQALVLSSDASGKLHHTTLGSVEGLDEAVTHWLNMPWTWPAEALHLGANTWVGRWHVEGGGWRLTMDSRPDLTRVFAESRGNSWNVVSHVGRLRRVDGQPFSSIELSDALLGLQVAISFAAGSWVSPGPVVCLRDGQPVGGLWAPWRCDLPGSPNPWWNSHRSQDLTEFVGKFLDHWASPDTRDCVRYFAMHVIEAGRHGSLEARILLLVAAVQYLYWVTYVLDRGLSVLSSGEPGFALKLDQMLREAKVPRGLPPELQALTQLAAERLMKPVPYPKGRFLAGPVAGDGPEAVAWMRNRLAHPKDAGEPYRIASAVQQAWSLLLEYAQLLLLHRVGYTGEFIRQYPPLRDASSSEPVPWA